MLTIIVPRTSLPTSVYFSIERLVFPLFLTSTPILTSPLVFSTLTLAAARAFTDTSFEFVNSMACSVTMMSAEKSTRVCLLNITISSMESLKILWKWFAYYYYIFTKVCYLRYVFQT